MRHFMISGGMIIILSVCFGFGCKKQDPLIYPDSDRTINIANGITIDNGVGMKNPIFNYVTYEDFLRHITTSDHFLIVPQKDFKNTTSTDKVVLSLRHDMDDNINAAVKIAYRDHKFGI